MTMNAHRVLDVGPVNCVRRARRLVCVPLAAVAMLVANHASGQCAFEFAEPVDYAAGVATADVAVVDVNNDGRLDVVAVNEGDSSLSVLLGNGDGTLAAALNSPLGTGPVSVEVADFDGDDALDLVVANRGAGDILVLLGNGDGTFGAPVSYAAGNDPRDAVIGDLDGDDEFDLVVANASMGDVLVLLGNGDGSFGTPVSYSLDGSNARLARLGDLNGDDRLDVVTMGLMPVAVLLGNGDGTLGPPTAQSFGLGHRDVALADLGGDGDLDVAVASRGFVAHVLPGDGTGTLGTAVEYDVNEFGEGAVFGDLNRDGRPDFVIAHDQVPSISILAGTSDDTLATPVTFGTSAALCVAVGDLDGDGREDIVTGASAGGVSVLLNMTPNPPLVDQHPEDLAVGFGETAVFTIAASRTTGYAWRLDGEYLSNAGHFSGVDTDTLVVDAATPYEAGAYDCVLTGDCGVTVSLAAELTVLEQCLADANGDGVVDTRDVLTFLNAWANGCP